MRERLPLTRRALSAWRRFQALLDAGDQGVFARGYGLHADEVVALSRLRANLAGLPPAEERLTKMGQVPAAVARALLAGLSVEPTVVALLCRALTPNDWRRRAALERALAKTLKGRMREMSGAELRERVGAEITRRGIDLMEPPDGLTKELALAIGANASAVSTVVAALKREARAATFRPAGIVANGNGAHAEPAPMRAAPMPDTPAVLLPTSPPPRTEPPPEALAAPAPTPPPDALRDLRAVLLEEGLRSVEPEALREPLRRLLLAMEEQP